MNAVGYSKSNAERTMLVEQKAWVQWTADISQKAQTAPAAKRRKQASWMVSTELVQGRETSTLLGTMVSPTTLADALVKLEEEK
jgi:hypothetical protein